MAFLQNGSSNLSSLAPCLNKALDGIYAMAEQQKTNPPRLGSDPETVELGAEFSFCVKNCSPLIKMCLGYATFVPRKAFQDATFVTVTKFGPLQMDQGIPIQNQSS